MPALDENDDGRQPDVTLVDIPRHPDLLLVDAPIIDAVPVRKSSNEELLCEMPFNLEKGLDKSAPTSSNSPNPIDARGSTSPFSFRNAGWAKRQGYVAKNHEVPPFPHEATCKVQSPKAVVWTTNHRCTCHERSKTFACHGLGFIDPIFCFLCCHGRK
jgi:hypothetical protein